MRNSFFLLLLLVSILSVKAQTYTSPITITSGGTYTGNWLSNDPNIPAVNIQTTQPVIIQNSRIQSKGVLINIANTGANVTVKNVCAYGLNPGVAGLNAGRFIKSSNSNNLVIENNYIESTAGIYILSFQGNGSASQTISIKYNQFLNIEGRASAGAAYRTDDVGYIKVQAVQFDKVQNKPNLEIAWNQIINEPYNSRSEDVINMYLSSGTTTSPILIHDNYINGSYPAAVATGSFSGGGILADGNPTTLADATAYLSVYNNQVVATTNYGIGIACGHNNNMYNNRVVASGYLSDNVTFISAQNVGAYVDNLHSNPYFSNNNIYNNAIAWNKKNITTGVVFRNDTYFPNCITGGCTGNTSLTPTLSYSTEQNEYTIWQRKLTSNSITIGSSLCSSSLPVKFSSFSLTTTANGVSINWSTAEEINSSYFTILRSIDGINFTALPVQIKANGTSSVTSEYSYTDAEPLNTIAYYKIEEFDINGSSQYSTIESINYSSPLSIKISPNPFTIETTIQVNGSFKEKLSLSVCDVNGHEYYNLQSIDAGSIISIGNALVPGLYIIKLSNTNTVFYNKIVKY